MSGRVCVLELTIASEEPRFWLLARQSDINAFFSTGLEIGQDFLVTLFIRNEYEFL